MRGSVGRGVVRNSPLPDWGAFGVKKTPAVYRLPYEINPLISSII